MGLRAVPYFGRIPDERYRDHFVANLGIQHIPKRMTRQLQVGREVRLFSAKNIVDSSWRREAQGIGDCVSWGAELACTCLLWNMAANGEISFPGRVATESIYGGCRVEVHGGPQMGYDSDGAAGSWAADWVAKWGVLLRQDYSAITGNKEHNLNKYSAKKAKDWGYYGCGGQSDRDELDEIARKYPVQDVTLVRNFEEAAAAISAGCPVTVASGVGFEGDRDERGFIRRNGSWPHQMVYLGVGWTEAGDGYLYQFNSWGDSASGPYPDVDDKAVQACSWRTYQEDVDRQLREQDSFAFSSIKGFTQDLYDFDAGLIV